MLKTPIAAKNIRIRVLWADSAEELTEEVNANLEAHSENAIYDMLYQLAMIPGDNNKHHERHSMVIFFRP